MSKLSITFIVISTVLGIPAWVWLMDVTFGRDASFASTLTLGLVGVVGWVYIGVTEIREARKCRPQRKGGKHRA